MKWPRWLAIAGIGIGALLLMFPLRGVVHQVIVIPLAYLLYVLELWYLTLPQAVWWFAIVLVVLFLLGRSLLIETRLPRKRIEPKKFERGRVEHLAWIMKRSQKGTYSKWFVANTLGRLAYQILLQRDHGKPRAVSAPLEGEDWNPSPAVRNYLEEGLHGSYTELPLHSWVPLLRREPIVLDHNPAEVIEFLESKVEDSALTYMH